MLAGASIGKSDGKADSKAVETGTVFRNLFLSGKGCILRELILCDCAWQFWR